MAALLLADWPPGNFASTPQDAQGTDHACDNTQPAYVQTMRPFQARS